jgi:hypothetical protein
VFAVAGVAFLFSGTVQDRVYDLVDKIRGEDDEMDDYGISPEPPPPVRSESAPSDHPTT